MKSCPGSRLSMQCESFFSVHWLMNGFSLILGWPVNTEALSKAVKYICHQANMHVDCSTHPLLVNVLFTNSVIGLFHCSRTLCDLTK